MSVLDNVFDNLFDKVFDKGSLNSHVKQVETNTGTVNATSDVLVLSTTSSSTVRHCFLFFELENLDGTGGDFEVTLTVGTQVNVYPFTLDAETDTYFKTHNFIIPSNNIVSVELKSPNVADTAIDLTTTLYDLSTTNTIKKTNDADFDLTTQQTILTVDANNSLRVGVLQINLNSMTITGGNLDLEISIGTLKHTYTKSIAANETETFITQDIHLPKNKEMVIKLTSPNSDTNVNVIPTFYETIHSSTSGGGLIVGQTYRLTNLNISPGYTNV